MAAVSNSSCEYRSLFTHTYIVIAQRYFGPSVGWNLQSPFEDDVERTKKGDAYSVSSMRESEQTCENRLKSLRLRYEHT